MFAESVVKPNAGKIDFAGFDPLFDWIVAVLAHYAALRLTYI